VWSVSRGSRRPLARWAFLSPSGITRALDNGASLEEVQRAAGHADATTTKLYDRRGHNPEKSASFFASY
jgi:integrase